MYLRNSIPKTIQLSSKQRTLIEWLIFTLIMLIALFFSSYTSSELKPFTLFDSLNTAENVYFDFGSYELEPGSYNMLDKDYVME